ncbi:MAG: hypothetical protein LKI25_00835 [Atopobiaceae bacterium]|jgi:hypothetical protein|nr:hypothetical protein [Atopobiaceae bacterium]MCI2172759.1 hypothetical protein [Atopobiaceae bacterium]MCI2207066.1 hypothetical protein [Atopobiaceae bacterium]
MPAAHRRKSLVPFAIAAFVVALMWGALPAMAYAADWSLSISSIKMSSKLTTSFEDTDYSGNVTGAITYTDAPASGRCYAIVDMSVVKAAATNPLELADVKLTVDGTTYSAKTSGNNPTTNSASGSGSLSSDIPSLAKHHNLPYFSAASVSTKDSGSIIFEIPLVLFLVKR